MKRTVLIGLLGLVVTACAPEMDRLDYSPDRLRRDVAQAMCSDDQSERARAISQISQKSEGFKINEVSDTVFELADEIAEDGCPAS